MLLTISLLNKGSLLGSFINKCRQVIRIKNVKPNETNLKPNISTSPQMPVVEPNNNRPSAVAHLSLSSPVTLSRTIEEQIGMPPKPKKPLTPYFRFMQQQRSKLLESNPKLSAQEAVKELSKQWQTVDAALKQRLQEEYKKDQQQYVEKRTKYDAKMTDEQREQIKELKQDMVEAKERRIMRKRIKELGRPKKPSSAFFKYIANERQVTPQGANQTFRDWHQKATEKWSTLTDEQKNGYIQESRKELELYKKEISLWEEKMIRMGNIDVVRHGNLIDPPEPKPKKR